jgi:aspartate 1-decarboxylase
MKLTLLKSKLHRATVTHAELDYEGSCAIDQDLLDAANILPFEQLHIYNVSNGERFTTYAIVAPRGSGTIGVNGAAAHKAKAGDVLILCTYAEFDAAEAAHFNPALVYLDENNAITHTSHGRLAAA